MSHDPHAALLELRHAATDRAMIVDVDERRLFAIDGIGEPSGSDFRLAADTLRQVARVLARSLRRDRFVTPRPGILECAWWTHPEIESGRISASELVDRVVRRGRAWISEVHLSGPTVALRACITSHRARPTDIDILVEELERAIRPA